MTLNILEFFQGMEEKRNRLAKAHRDEKDRLEQSIAFSEDEVVGLEGEMKKKEALKEQIIREDIDVTKFLGRIADLKALIDKTNEEIISQKAQLKALVAPPAYKNGWEKNLVDFLKSEYDCEFATQVKSVAECWDFFSVGKMAQSGRRVHVYLNEEGNHEFNGRSFQVVKEGQPYVRPERPQELRWLPGDSNSESTNGKPKPSVEDNVKQPAPCAFIDQNGNLILQIPSAYAISGCGIRSPEEVADFKARVVSLADQLAETHKTENGRVDLVRTYDDNALLKRLKDYVAGQIKPDSLNFEPTDEKLASSSIYQKIKKEWDRLASCPWSKDITGPVAMLKYLVENGEQARFWVAGFKNYYGFRLRTRDHTWIKGHMFIDSKQTVDMDKATIQIVAAENSSNGSHGSQKCIVMGNVWLQVEESRE